MKRKWVRLLIAGLVVGIGLAWSRQRLLLRRAHPVATLQATDYDWGDQWDWLSDDQLVILTSAPGVGKSPGWRGQVDLLNVATGSRTPMPGLTTLLNRPDVSPEGTPYSFQMSPDRSWLIWLMDVDSNQSLKCGVAHLDGTGYRDWKLGKLYDWFYPDNGHLANQDLAHPEKLIIRDFQDRRRDRVWGVNTPQAKALMAQHAAQSPIYVDTEQRHDSPTDPFTIRIYRTQDTLKAMSYDHRETEVAPTPLQSHEVKFPEGATVIYTDLGEGNTKVFYQLQIATASSFRAWLHRLLPMFPVTTTVEEGFWVSGVDGKDLREIGHLPARKVEDAGTFELETAEWLPGDKKISFVYHGVLYVVDADPKI